MAAIKAAGMMGPESMDAEVRRRAIRAAASLRRNRTPRALRVVNAKLRTQSIPAAGGQSTGVQASGAALAKPRR